ncbi:Disease resistance RPP13-like protein 4 [Triticum urartu]|uniref:Disease resistance RPP13-like protein 4 n=1 Tax=Triticum urartu TaxID=4572 RepID=M7YKV0_TRIUA|nr:Disease resistance RPP13-like protein 4 [Triticum urartu]
MEAALVSVATGVLKPVIGKLTVLLGNEYKRFKTVRKEIKSLTNELAAMEAFLLKMSEEEDPDVQDKVWMNEVRELSYDMEDAIDDFMQSIGDKDEKPDGFIEKIKNSLGKLGKMKAHRRIGKEIQDLKKQIKEVGERNARYKGRQTFTSTKNETVDPRALAIFEHASNLVGIDEPKAEIIKLLAQEDVRASTQQQLKIISIVGSGGIGKTTLANQVYQELKGQFKRHAFISVSRNPDIMNILRAILSKVSGQSNANTEAWSIEQLISKITNFLGDTRYFVFADDIWDVKTWNVIKCAFPTTSSGSIIIITTRINDVADSCRSSCNGHIYNIRHLDMVHSRQLFNRRLFDSNEDCPSHLKKVSGEILEKCVGLPLAIISISGLLATTERTEHRWNQVKDSIGRALERNPSVEGMIKILSLSYFDLPPRLKTCLLYVSIFPEDSIIEKKALIWRWIAEGIIHKDDIYTSYQLGERCFNELVNRCLIQVTWTDEYGKVENCRVHDIILDFIISKAIEENFVTFVGVPYITIGAQRKVRRLSLQVDEKEKSISKKGLVLSHVRSVNAFGCTVEIPSLDEFRYLRVLDFELCRQVENNHLANIGSLFQLRHLNLSWTEVSELPEEIGRLHCLEMLDIRGTKVHELPATIVNLKKLVDLLVDTRVKFPNGIAKMQAMEMLEQVGVFRQQFNFLQELGQLQNMRKLVLDFEGDPVTVDGMGKDECNEAIAYSLRNLEDFISLTVHGGSFLQQGPGCPVPHSIQELFMTKSSPLPRVPVWVSSLVNLQQLHLQVKEFEQEDLCILGSLPALLILELITGDVMRNRKLTVSAEAGFRCLRKFSFGIFNWMMFEAGSMPKLQKLELRIWLCNRFDMIVAARTASGGAFDFGIGNLPCLITVKYAARGCNVCMAAAKAAVERAAGRYPNRPTLLFQKLDATYTLTDCQLWRVDCEGWGRYYKSMYNEVPLAGE